MKLTTEKNRIMKDQVSKSTESHIDIFNSPNLSLAGSIDWKSMLRSRLASIDLMTLAIGLVYLWFGALKLFPHISPAESLAVNTIDRLTFGMIASNVALMLLAILEVSIGLGFLLRVRLRQFTILAFGHMICTFTPLVFFPGEMWGGEPFQLTLVGQYIIKNLIIIAALVHVYQRSK